MAEVRRPYRKDSALATHKPYFSTMHLRRIWAERSGAGYAVLAAVLKCGGHKGEYVPAYQRRPSLTPLAAPPPRPTPRLTPRYGILWYAGRGDAQKGGSVLVRSSFVALPGSSLVATKSPPLMVVSNEAPCFFAKHYLVRPEGLRSLPFCSAAEWAGPLWGNSCRQIPPVLLRSARTPTAGACSEGRCLPTMPGASVMKRP